MMTAIPRLLIRSAARRSHHPLPPLLRPNEPIRLGRIGRAHIYAIPLKRLARADGDDASQTNLRQQSPNLEWAVGLAFAAAGVDPLSAVAGASRQCLGNALRRLVAGERGVPRPAAHSGQ